MITIYIIIYYVHFCIKRLARQCLLAFCFCFHFSVNSFGGFNQVMVLKLLKNAFKIIDKIMDWLANLIIFVVFCFGSSQLLIGYFDEKKEEIKYIRGHSTTKWTKLPNFDPLPPRVDNWGHFTWYLTLCHMTKRGLSTDPPHFCPRSYWMTPYRSFYRNQIQYPAHLRSLCHNSNFSNGKILEFDITIYLKPGPSTYFHINNFL